MGHEKPAEILLVDHDPAVGQEVVSFLSKRKYAVEWVDQTEKAYNYLDQHTFDVLVTEVGRRRINGMRLMGVAKARNPEVCVIMTTEDPDFSLATEAMRQGAYDFQTKPLNMAKLEAVIQRGIGYQHLVYEQQELRRRLDEHYGLSRLLGRSRAIVQAYNTIRQAAPSALPVIVAGEAGTGKDLIAQAVHNSSARRDGPLVKLDCASGPPSLVRSELFGIAGAEGHAGRLELADGGTLYLDHVENLPLALHDGLLAVARERRVWRDGGDKAIRVDIRLIVSVSPEGLANEHTAALLEALREQHDAVTVELPPLRERPEDIPLLVEAFIHELNVANEKNVAGITRNALDILIRYPWPGNVTELRNTIHGMALVASEGQRLDVLDVPAPIRQGAAPGTGEIRIPAGATMGEVERIMIEETMKACGYQKEACARQLGIGLRTLYRKLKEYEEG